MQLGLALSVQHRPEDSQAARFAEHVEQVRLARAVGFVSVWASQHYLSDPFTYFQPLPTLGRMAAEAEGMTLGTGVLVLPLHQPVDLAEQLATLDVITGGRLVVGVGLGYRDAENEAMGTDPRARVGRFVEGLEALERLWSGEPVNYQGRHFTLREARISMPPLQRPRPPVWLAANTDAGVRRAARLGDAWLMNPHTTLVALERQLALFRETRRAEGRPPAHAVPLIRECCVAPTAAAARAAGGPFLDEKYGAYRSWAQDQALPADDRWSPQFEELARDRFLLGDPAAIAEEIARYRERLGVTALIVRVQWPGMAQADVLRSIRLLGEQVLPALPR
ncbi:MAG TPA: LLM class flavin-dependent oxidoreductase [Methylomirabilota bacterium]|nr:LLM class flavin-dependent oxidoreductase [Methylomirabilota bacterium]